MVIFPLAPDQTIAQMWSNGARGGAELVDVQEVVQSQNNRPWMHLSIRLSPEPTSLTTICH